MRLKLVLFFCFCTILTLVAREAWAYRPFVSTDAAVAGLKEMEIELGYFNLQRANGQSTYTIPSVVLNYGLFQRLEVVAESNLEIPPDEDARLVDSALSLKRVFKEGVLQGEEGISFAIEAGALLPSTAQGEKRFGFEGVGILSGRISPFTFHINLGGGVDRDETNPFFVWGVIGEFPMTLKFRLVGEINGESHKKMPVDTSGLLGLIWQSPRPNLSFDAGVRRGISRTSPDWQFTAGLTFGFQCCF